MKEFRTELRVQPAREAMSLKSAVLTQGSCFSDAIGDRLAEHKLKTLVNPFGVIYNPESIHKVLLFGIYNEPVPGHTFIQHQDLHLNFNFHSRFSSAKKDDLTQTITNTIGAVHYFLKDADWLMITYGTAWVYARKDTGEIVANCHKLPSSTFSKNLMSVEAVVSSFKTMFEHVKRFNPDLKVILTVSPVRHVNDTLELNSVSKAVLRLACHQLAGQFDDVEYFPAYEIMMDDLRDYRFYKSDMLHPTTDAEDYIWEKFMERYFSPDLREFVERWRPIHAALRHRPFHPGSTAHQQFLGDMLKKLEALRPIVDVGKEVSAIKKQLEQ